MYLQILHDSLNELSPLFNEN